MKFSHKISPKRRQKFREEFIRGIWNPKINNWRDIIEDLICISRKRLNNKFILFRLQMNILTDIIQNTQAIDAYKQKLDDFSKQEGKGLISKEDAKFFESEIMANNIINRALKEVVDGIVWRLFNYNRAFLYLLADKEPMGPIRMDKGMIESLYELADIFLDPENIAMLNDISNFLRIGDITKIGSDGNIELIEVKSSGGRGGRRIQRQKQKMSELVEFINTGIREYDGRKLTIYDSNITQVHYFQNLLDALNRSQNKGYDSILIGDHLILEIVNYHKIDDINNAIEYFKKRHESTKERWDKNDDKVFTFFLSDKMEYSRNFIPYSILPYDSNMCADIITGKMMIRSLINISEIMRKIQKSGWQIIDSFFLKTEEEIKKLEGQDVKDLTMLKIRKSGYNINIPHHYFGKLVYELWSPKSMIEVFEEGYNRDQHKDYDAYLLNFLDDQRIWK